MKQSIIHKIWWLDRIPHAACRDCLIEQSIKHFWAFRKVREGVVTLRVGSERRTSLPEKLILFLLDWSFDYKQRPGLVPWLLIAGGTLFHLLLISYTDDRLNSLVFRPFHSMTLIGYTKAMIPVKCARSICITGSEGLTISSNSLWVDTVDATRYTWYLIYAIHDQICGFVFRSLIHTFANRRPESVNDGELSIEHHPLVWRYTDLANIWSVPSAALTFTWPMIGASLSLLEPFKVSLAIDRKPSGVFLLLLFMHHLFLMPYNGSCFLPMNCPLNFLCVYIS